MAIKLIIDTTSDLIQSDVKEDFVTVLPIKVYFGSEEFIEGVNMTKEEFFVKLEASKDLPKTAQITPPQFKELFSGILDSGDEVLGIFLSSELSGTYNSAMMARKELDEKRIRVVDSRHLTFGYRSLVDEAIKLIKEGRDLEYIYSEIERLKDKVVLLAVLDDLKYVKKGGRFSSTMYVIASTLHIKPILTLKDGLIIPCGKAIGYKRACSEICKMINALEVDHTRPFYMAHGMAPEMERILEEHLVEKTSLKEFVKCRVGISVGTYTGPECAGVSFFKK